MGIDVRFFIEYKNTPKGKWIGLSEFFPDRNSRIINELWHYSEKRKLPEDYSTDFFERAFVYISPENEINNCIGDKFCTKEIANDWVSEYKSIIYHSDNANADWVLDPEFESTSWLFFSEFKGILNKFSCISNDYHAIFECMKALEAKCGTNSTRLIFWYC